MNAMSHRGPDDSGEWSSEKYPIWIGHRRLSIIDPEGGKQPIANEDESIWITFNGCIYNYLELSQSLRRRGHKFRTHTDTEAIIHAYEEWGEGCLEKLIGMFAFALWDERTGSMFCARDRLGIKPFYFVAGTERFLFASEIKSLLASEYIAPEICQEALQEYLVFQASLCEKTFFKDIEKLLPGEFMIVDADGKICKRKKYWDVSFEVTLRQREEFLVDHLRILIGDAVKIRLRSDVPLGAHLSGGLDSSTVVCFANDIRDSNDEFSTFTGAFNEQGFDETGYARMISEYVKSRHFEIRPGGTDFTDHISDIMYYMDQPAAGPGVFPQYMVSKIAAENVKVVLGGQGGDEIFAGYARYLVGYLEECLQGVIEETADVNKYAATLSTLIPNLPMLKKYTPMLQYFWAEGLFGPQEDRYFRLMDRSAGMRDICAPDMFSEYETIRQKFNTIFNGSNAESFLNRMLYFDLKVHLPSLLQVEDRTSMAWGLESRIPLLDHRIVEHIAGISTNIKFSGGKPKYLFRKAIRNIVPDEIMNRKDKMGFPVPLSKWIHNELGDFVNDILFSKKAQERGIFNSKRLRQQVKNEKSFGRVIWGALCLELWFREFIDDKRYLRHG